MRHDRMARQHQSHVEGWRANVPLFRAIATSMSIILSVIWLSWQGSQWVTRIETRLSAIEMVGSTKANAQDVDYRFALQCARAPAQYKPWICDTAALAAVAPKTK